MCPVFVGRGRRSFQALLDFVRCFARGEACAVRDPENMGVDGDGWMPKSLIQHHIGRFSSDPRQFD